MHSVPASGLTSLDQIERKKNHTESDIHPDTKRDIPSGHVRPEEIAVMGQIPARMQDERDRND